MAKRMSGLPEKLQAARFQAVRQWPYLSSALWILMPVEVDPAELRGMNTLAVDKYWRLYYDPVAVAQWNVAELAGVLYHEIGHLLRDHAGRGEQQSAHPEVWNIAGDCEINDDLLAEKVALPGVAVSPKTYGYPDGELVEQYYARLMNDPKVVRRVQLVMSGGGPGAGDGEADGETPGAGSGSGKKAAKGQGKGQGKDPQPGQGPSGGACGSCANGTPQPWELGAPDQANPGVGEGEAEILRVQIANTIAEHASKGRGTVPGQWERWAKQKLKPKVDWRQAIRGMVRAAVADTAGMVNYSYQKPSRRQGSNTGVVMPALRRPEPRVACAIDTSGSMGTAELAQAVAEVGGVLRKLGLRDGVPVFAVDSQVHHSRTVFRLDQVKLVGGGGTDMGEGIAAAYRMKPRPHVCIVLTDGMTPWPALPTPGMGVIAAIVGQHGTGDNWQVPAWIKKVVVPYEAFHPEE